MQKQESKAKLTIGNVKLNSNVILAPMAGITDSVLRQLIRLYTKKCLVTSEMVSSEALKWNQDKSILAFDKVEPPLAFQLSGHKPDLMAEGAKQIEDISTIIDINMGCPAPKIVKNLDGARLMTDLKLASEIITAVKKAVNVPVTVKCRLGWDNNSKNVLEFAKMAEDSGADALTVHGRTKSQMYSGIADWQMIANVKNTLKIPVIANGDITSPEKALECLEVTGCDGIAVGRAIIGDPSLLYRIEEAVENGNIIPEPSLKERIDLVILHTKMEIALRGELNGVKFMRKFYGWYIKGIRDATKHRTELVKQIKFSEIERIFNEILDYNI